MAFETANDIIKEAFGKIGLNPEDGNLSGNKAQIGLDFLNAQLEQYESENQLIAYNGLLNFPLVAGQEKYIISPDSGLSPDVIANKIVRLKYVVITSDSIQYPVDIVEDFVWYRHGQNLNLTGRPRQIYLQNEPKITNLIFLKKPEKVYECIIKGKFNLSTLDFTTDITTLPRYYILFLIYELARILADYYPGTDWSQLSESIYQRYKSNLTSGNDNDLTVRTSSALNYHDSKYRSDFYSY